MSSKIVKKQGNKITIEMEIELDPNSMLNSEEQISEVLHQAGLQATQEALEQFDTDGRAIDHQGRKWTTKGREKKVSNTLRRVGTGSSHLSKE